MYVDNCEWSYIKLPEGTRFIFLTSSPKAAEKYQKTGLVRIHDGFHPLTSDDGERIDEPDPFLDHIYIGCYPEGVDPPEMLAWIHEDC